MLYRLTQSGYHSGSRSHERSITRCTLKPAAFPPRRNAYPRKVESNSPDGTLSGHHPASLLRDTAASAGTRHLTMTMRAIDHERDRSRLPLEWQTTHTSELSHPSEQYARSRGWASRRSASPTRSRARELLRSTMHPRRTLRARAVPAEQPQTAAARPLVSIADSGASGAAYILLDIFALVHSPAHDHFGARRGGASPHDGPRRCLSGTGLGSRSPLQRTDTCAMSPPREQHVGLSAAPRSGALRRSDSPTQDRAGPSSSRPADGRRSNCAKGRAGRRVRLMRCEQDRAEASRSPTFNSPVREIATAYDSLHGSQPARPAARHTAQPTRSERYHRGLPLFSRAQAMSRAIDRSFQRGSSRMTPQASGSS